MRSNVVFVRTTTGIPAFSRRDFLGGRDTLRSERKRYSTVHMLITRERGGVMPDSTWNSRSDSPFCSPPCHAFALGTRCRLPTTGQSLFPLPSSPCRRERTPPASGALIPTPRSSSSPSLSIPLSRTRLLTCSGGYPHRNDHLPLKVSVSPLSLLARDAAAATRLRDDDDGDAPPTSTLVRQDELDVRAQPSYPLDAPTPIPRLPERSNAIERYLRDRN